MGSPLLAGVPASPRAKTSAGLGVDFIGIDQGHVAISHLAGAALELGSGGWAGAPGVWPWLSCFGLGGHVMAA